MADVLEIEGADRKEDDFLKLKKCILRGVCSAIPGLDLLPNHLKLTFVDLELASRPGRERILNRTLAKIKDDYDIILIDCPPNLQAATQNALYASDYYLVPAQADYLSALGLQLLTERLEYLKEELEFKTSASAWSSHACAWGSSTTLRTWPPGRNKRSLRASIS